MANIFEKFLRKKEKPEEIISEPSLVDLANALPSEELKNEFFSLIKELGGEAGHPDYYKGNYDNLTPEQRRYNEILQVARKEYFGIGEEGYEKPNNAQIENTKNIAARVNKVYFDILVNGDNVSSEKLEISMRNRGRK